MGRQGFVAVKHRRLSENAVEATHTYVKKISKNPEMIN